MGGIRSRDLEEDKALLEEGVTMDAGFEVSKTQARPSISLFLLPVDQDVKLSATSATFFLPVCHQASCHDDNGLNR